MSCMWDDGYKMYDVYNVYSTDSMKTKNCIKADLFWTETVCEVRLIRLMNNNTDFVMVSDNVMKHCEKWIGTIFLWEIMD